MYWYIKHGLRVCVLVLVINVLPLCIIGCIKQDSGLPSYKDDVAGEEEHADILRFVSEGLLTTKEVEDEVGYNQPMGRWEYSHLYTLATNKKNAKAGIDWWKKLDEVDAVSEAALVIKLEELRKEREERQK